MDKWGKLLKAFTEIDNAVEISKATLTTIQEGMEEEHVSWALIGVIQQLEKISDAVVVINSVIKESGEAVTA